MIRRVALFAGVTLALPVSARADAYVSTFLENLTGPWVGWPNTYTTWPPFYPDQWLWFFGLVAAIAIVEALSVRRYAKGQRFRRVASAVFVANLVTALIGLFFSPRTYDIWIPMSIAFAASVLLEWPVMRLLKGLGQQSMQTYLRASLRMNAFSYALMAVFVAVLMYAPTLGTEDRGLLRNLRGTLVIVDEVARVRTDGGRTDIYPPHALSVTEIDLNQTPPAAKRAFLFRIDNPNSWSCGPGIISGTCGVESRRIFRITRTRGHWHLSIEQTPERIGTAWKVSPDGNVIWARDISSDRHVLFDTRQNRVLCKWTGECLPDARFTSDSRYFTWGSRTTCMAIDLTTGRAIRCHSTLAMLRVIAPPGQSVVYRYSGDLGAQNAVVVDPSSGRRAGRPLPGIGRPRWDWETAVAWSPDRRLIAYPATQLSMYPYVPDARLDHIRLATADGRRTVTLWRSLPRPHGGYQLMWLP